MRITLPLGEMTLQEKIEAMELLWDDLVRSPEGVDSPAWHKSILEERGQRVSGGTAHFADWEEAKAEIRDKLK